MKHAITGRSRHTVPANNNNALVGTGKPGSTTNPANNSHGRSIKNPSATFHQAFKT